MPPRIWGNAHEVLSVAAVLSNSCPCIFDWKASSASRLMRSCFLTEMKKVFIRNTVAAFWHQQSRSQRETFELGISKLTSFINLHFPTARNTPTWVCPHSLPALEHHDADVQAGRRRFPVVTLRKHFLASSSITEFGHTGFVPLTSWQGLVSASCPTWAISIYSLPFVSLSEYPEKKQRHVLVSWWPPI